jgi:hypothetical protein
LPNSKRGAQDEDTEPLPFHFASLAGELFRCSKRSQSPWESVADLRHHVNDAKFLNAETDGSRFTLTFESNADNVGE